MQLLLQFSADIWLNCSFLG